MFTGTRQYLYARAYSLTIGPKEGGQSFQYGNTIANTAALRIAFDVTKIAVGAANKGTVTLYNVSQDTRTALVRGYQVILEAGYQGLTERLLAGTVFKATTKREGPDIITTLDVIDGLKSLLYATFDRSYPKGTTLAKILADIAKAMDAQPGTVLGIPAKTFARGYHVHGLCRDALETLLKPYSLEASINNGKLNIIPRRASLGTTAIVLSPQTGLLGIPSVAQTAIEFEALLNPKLVPGQLVRLETANPNTSGFFKIRSCKMHGDTHAANWTVSCQGVRATNVRAALSPAQGFDYGQAVVPGLI